MILTLIHSELGDVKAAHVDISFISSGITWDSSDMDIASLKFIRDCCDHLLDLNI